MTTAPVRLAPFHVSAVSSWSYGFDEDLALWESLGVRHVGLASWKLESAGLADAARRVAERGLAVSSLLARGFDLANPASWAEHTDRLLACLEAARVMGCPTVSLLTGRHLGRTWAEHRDLFAAATADVRAAAAAVPVSLALEHTSPLRADVGFVFSVGDAVDLARAVEMTVCVDLNPSWSERDVETTLATASGEDLIAVLQVSDHSPDIRCAGHRLVPGDGTAPLGRLLSAALRHGYAGPIELELLGPAIEQEGYATAIGRGLQALRTMVIDGVSWSDGTTD